MKHNDFECRQCGAHFNSRAELQRHNHDEHSQYGRSGSASSSGSMSGGMSEGESSRRAESYSGSKRDEG